MMRDPVTGNRTVLNVTNPDITIYKPEKNANMTAVLICPGGAFHVSKKLILNSKSDFKNVWRLTPVWFLNNLKK
ncbi:hypothetical protein Dfri01_47480 [Dyadobacter frigoris]|nr:hypothetical protein Dfri01_47480 [Dyadobacter frigoris]